MTKTHQPETPAHTYIRLGAMETKTAETEMIMRACITPLTAAENRYYGGYPY